MKLFRSPLQLISEGLAYPAQANLVACQTRQDFTHARRCEPHLLSAKGGRRLPSSDLGVLSRVFPSVALRGNMGLLGATPWGYTGNPGRAKKPCFTGLSRSHFKVAEREGIEPHIPLEKLRQTGRQRGQFDNLRRSEGCRSLFLLPSVLPRPSL
jgi:hypothetical protein